MQTALEQSEKIVTHDFIEGRNVVSWSLPPQDWEEQGVQLKEDTP